jgi:hypothetical protein
MPEHDDNLALIWALQVFALCPPTYEMIALPQDREYIELSL